MSSVEKMQVFLCNDRLFLKRTDEFLRKYGKFLKSYRVEERNNTKILRRTRDTGKKKVTWGWRAWESNPQPE
jgi:hypothetical protein